MRIRDLLLQSILKLFRFSIVWLWAYLIVKVIPEVLRVYLIRDLRFYTALQFNYFILDDIAENFPSLYSLFVVNLFLIWILTTSERW
jgi:hypothetical protein